jgi:hypothetical protein
VKSLPDGYTLRPDGFYEKTCEFMISAENPEHSRMQCREILIRDKRGTLWTKMRGCVWTSKKKFTRDVLTRLL